MIRAKFRCMDCTDDWNRHRIFRFRPVMQGGGKDNENKKFWSASPSGEAELQFKTTGPDEPRQYEVGSYYYIDFVPDDEGTWVFSRRTQTAGYDGGEIHLSHNPEVKDYDAPGARYSSLKMSIENSPAFAMFDAVGQRWGVRFSFAEPADD